MPLAELPITLEGEIAGLVSEAEGAIRRLNDSAPPALAPLARLLLRTESIASPKVEGRQAGVRELARAESRMETGGSGGPTSAEILANIDAMELAVHEAATVERFGVEQILAIHARLMERAPNSRIAGRLRTVRTGSAETTTIHAGRTSCRRRPRRSSCSSPICATRWKTMCCRRSCRRLSCTPSSRRSTRSTTATAVRGAPEDDPRNPRPSARRAAIAFSGREVWEVVATWEEGGESWPVLVEAYPERAPGAGAVLDA